MKLLMTLLEAIAIILGAASPEELDSADVERFSWMNAHPLDMNYASRRELAESGLFSDFQIVSLLDYISVSGAVLSRSELAYVDGFDAETAEALSFFVSFSGIPESGGKWRSESRVHAGLPDGYGANLYLSRGKSFELALGGAGGWNARSSGGTSSGVSSAGTSGQGLKAVTLSACSSLARGRLRLYAGDFNLRFGQGLSAWNTMTVENPSSASTLIRRPSGLKISRSLSGKYASTGAGTEFEAGPLTFTAAVTVPNLKTVLLSAVNSVRRKTDVAGLHGLFNCSWWHSRFSLGLTASVTGTPLPGMRPWDCRADFSSDFRGCFGGFDLAAEVAGGYGVPLRAVVSAVSPKLAEHFRVGTSLRCEASRHSAVLVSEYSSRKGHSASACLRFRHPVLPSAGQKNGSSVRGGDNLRADVRYGFARGERFSASLRMRGTWNMGIPASSVYHFRGDLSAGYGGIWKSSVMAAFSRGSKCGMAVFVEESCAVSGKFSAFLRTGIFSVDDWNGRIYVYEHDVYGRFNVPALYGRGVWVSFFSSWKFSRAGKVSLRTSWRGHPFMPPSSRRPDKVEARVLLELYLPPR